MHLDETVISRGIVQKYMEELMDYMDTEVAIVGGGPSGMVAAYYLAKKGCKVALFDRKLAVGGGMWGGAMMFNKIVVQSAGKRILDEFAISCHEYERGYYVADAVESVTTIASMTVKAGCKIFNLISAEDVMVEDGRVTGLVLNWTPVQVNNYHVDPLVVRAKYVIDGTGHPAEVTQTLTCKMGVRLNTPTGGVAGEKPMNALKGELDVVENTREVFPGLYVTGMAANAAFGSHRMGPVFGGMLLSGEKAAMEIAARLGK